MLIKDRGTLGGRLGHIPGTFDGAQLLSQAAHPGCRSNAAGDCAVNLLHVIRHRGVRRNRSATVIRRRAAGRVRRPWHGGLMAGGVVLAVATGLVVIATLAVPRIRLLGALDGSAANAAPGPFEDGPIRLVVRSQPGGARVVLDGRDRGRTPLEVGTNPGRHAVLLQADSTIPMTHVVDVGPSGASLEVALWTRKPTALRLRPPYPGAQLVDGAFLPDGRLALIVAIPDLQPGQSQAFVHEAWVVGPPSPRDSAVIATAVGPRAPAVAVSPGG